MRTKPIPSGDTNYLKRCVVPMLSDDGTEQEFDLIIYGKTKNDLLTVPNEVISSLARRYPGYSSSPFLVYDLEYNDV